MLNNFLFLPDGSVRSRLSTQFHLQLLQDFYSFESKLDRIIVPILLMPCGTGNENIFSTSVEEDVSCLVREVSGNGIACKVQWFESSGHDLPSSSPLALMKCVFENIDEKNGIFQQNH